MSANSKKINNNSTVSLKTNSACFCKTIAGLHYHHRSKGIYLDYAASTPIDPKVITCLEACLKNNFANSASLHLLGREARICLEKSRSLIAKLIGASPEEIVFTSSATESNNLAIKGIFFSAKQAKKHIIISAIEHKCVLESAYWLKSQGCELTILQPSRKGRINPDDVKESIRPNTILVSVMHANNEIGTIQPIEQIGRICRKRGIYFHTDAAQSFGRLNLDVGKMPIDLLTASSHKVYGPKGAALLYIKKGVNIEPLLHGGGHEFGLRSSTVNIPAIAGFAAAARIAWRQMEKETLRLKRISEYLIDYILRNIPGAYLNSDEYNRIAHILNFRFDGIRGDDLMLALDRRGIMVSVAAGCATFKMEPSYVLLACGLEKDQALASIRISLGRYTTYAEIKKAAEIIKQEVERLRKIS